MESSLYVVAQNRRKRNKVRKDRTYSIMFLHLPYSSVYVASSGNAKLQLVFCPPTQLNPPCLCPPPWRICALVHISPNLIISGAAPCQISLNLSKYCPIAPRLDKCFHILSNCATPCQMLPTVATSWKIAPNLAKSGATSCQILSCFPMARQSCPFWQILKSHRTNPDKVNRV